MILAEPEQADLSTAWGSMRIELFRPQGGVFPGLVLFSEIFQITAPIRRMARYLAGHGYVVSVPEIFHELEDAPGVVLGYDDAGKDRGNAHKAAKELESYDADARAALRHLAGHPACTGRLGTIGICIGGHLALRAALESEVRAAACFYATDVHGGTLGAGARADTLERAGETAAELLLVWGRQDPHTPPEGRALIHERLSRTPVCFSWHEVNAQHAFLRDEGPRYDPALAAWCYAMAFELFHRRLCSTAD